MTYATIQTAVANVIKKLTDYDATNVDENDHRKLADGLEKAAICRRGNAGTPRSGQQDLTGGDRYRHVRRDDWVVHVELFMPFRTDVASLRNDLTGEAEIILAELDKWPSLDGHTGIFDLDADIVPEATEWLFADARWFMQLLIVNVQEQSEVLVSETQLGQPIFRYGGSNSLYGTAVYR